MPHIIGNGYSPVDWAVTGICATSLTLQIYLVYLIAYVSPPAMKEYRPFLLIITLCDTVLTAAELLLTPDFLYPASCLLVNGPVGYLGSKVSLFALYAALFAAFNAIMQQDFSLAYRLLVCMQSDDWKRRLLDKRTVLVVQFVINGSLIALMFDFSTTFLSDEAINEYLQRYIDGDEKGADGTPAVLPLFDENSTILCNLMWPPEKGDRLLAIFGALILLTEVFGISTATSIFVILRRNSQYFTTQTRRMHMQLTALLVMQLLSPLVCMVVPVGNLFVRLIFDATAGQKTSAVNALAFPLYVFSNTALTVLFITPYRRHLLGRLLRLPPFGTAAFGSGFSSKPHHRDAWN